MKSIVRRVSRLELPWLVRGLQCGNAVHATGPFDDRVRRVTASNIAIVECSDDTIKGRCLETKGGWLQIRVMRLLPRGFFR